MKIIVLAGPNGAGKTFLHQDYVPDEVTYINSDEISKELRRHNPGKNMQEAAQGLAVSQLNEAISNRKSIALETNLADQDTFKWLVSLNTVMPVEISYITAPLSVCQKRVDFRYKSNTGHFVRPEIVAQRHSSSMVLIAHYFDQIKDISFYLNERSEKRPTLIAEKKIESGIKIHDKIPDWFSQNLKNVLDPEYSKTRLQVPNLTKDEILKKYKDSQKDKGQGL